MQNGESAVHNMSKICKKGALRLSCGVGSCRRLEISLKPRGGNLLIFVIG